MIAENLVATPNQIKQPSVDVKLTYEIGSAARARDRVLTGGLEISPPRAFDVTGTRDFPQKRQRTVTLERRDVDFATVTVMIQELDEQDEPIGGELKCSVRVRMK